MASHSERGIANILAHFASLISFCKGYGAKYNPSNSSLTVKSLQALYDSADASLDSIKEAKAALQTAVKDRKVLFKPLKQLCTRVINSLAVSGAPKETVANAETENHKIQGSRAEAIEPPAPAANAATDAAAKTAAADAEEKHISASQQSFDQQVDHFAQLVKILAAEPKYAPNETDLQTAALQDLLANMKTVNQALIDGLTDVSNSQIARNNIFNAEETGLVDVAGNVKKYVKSVFTASGLKFKQVSGLEFQ